MKNRSRSDARDEMIVCARGPQLLPADPTPGIESRLVGREDTLIQQHRYAEAIPFARKAIRQAPTGTLTRAYATFNLGLALLDLGRCRDSLPVLQSALTLEPASQHARVSKEISRARSCTQGAASGPAP